jgi:hypothetical protein
MTPNRRSQVLGATFPISQTGHYFRVARNPELLRLLRATRYGLEPAFPLPWEAAHRTDEISPGLFREVSAGKVGRSGAAELFEISTSRPSIQQEVIDEANSTFCDGYYSDGGWVHTNTTCEDRVTYRQVASLSPYVSVKVDLAPPSLQAAVD